MEPLAHSAKPDQGIESQSYETHTCNVVKQAAQNAVAAFDYFSGDSFNFMQTVINAALCHDLGKLDKKNQHVLQQVSGKSLPIRHEDAGAAFLLGQRKDIPAALLASQHHQGLPDLYEEKRRKELFLRHEKAYPRTEKYLTEYISIHNRYLPHYRLPSGKSRGNTGWNGLRFRLALSCLADGDHCDTARHYRKEQKIPPPPCRWEERLASLEHYTDCLFQSDPEKERNILRRDIFQGCRNTQINNGITACDSPVGTGKTTAVMAYLLQTAIKKGLRHIIVVLPYTNIIKQSVETYRKALVLADENPSEIIAEHHHQADFDHVDNRHLATLWKAPITVTTAVQFFETIAANRPSRLRKLHELPGSGIFVDEVHAAIPSWMWPQMWQWVNELATEWSCHFVLASGSLPKFWQLAQVANPPQSIPELVPEESRCKAIHAEQDRIEYFTHQTSLDLSGLVQFILSKQGPRLVIMNTVQSAAVVANELHSKYGQEVLHLSTALCPIDRDKVIEQIESRLDDKLHTDWTLVATSCIEAGMDFSFATAFRESCSVSSLIQIGGRVNRHGDDPISEIWDFRIDVDEAFLNQYPAFGISRMVLADLFSEDKMNRLPSAELATEAMRREIMTDYDKRAGAIKDREKKCDYPEVAKLCQVIDADTRIVVISSTIVQALEQRTKIDQKELLRHSVQLWSKKIKDLALEPILTCSELYKMPEDQYGAFSKDQIGPCFGYMKGILPLVYASRDGLI